MDYYFFIDAETDGLYGEVIAIGAIVTDKDGKEIDRFSGKIDLEKIEISDEWTKKNVLSLIYDLPNYITRDELLKEFWEFWLRYRENAHCIADVAYPVEMGLFKACVLKNIGKNKFLAPFPLLDLSTLLFTNNLDPLINRDKLIKNKIKQHNPINDVLIMKEIWFKYNSKG